MSELMGWARKEQGGWLYLCPAHPPEVYAGWEMVRRYTPMTQGPAGRGTDDFPPLCGECGADLRDA